MIFFYLLPLFEMLSNSGKSLFLKVFFACKNQQCGALSHLNLAANRGDCMQLFYISSSKAGRIRRIDENFRFKTYIYQPSAGGIQIF